MIVLLLFALLSGIVTILSPCILPVLPVVLSGSVGGKSRPFGVIAGFVVSFSVFTLLLSTIVQAFGIAPDALRIAAVVLMLFFGLVMLVPRLRHGFEMVASRLAGSVRLSGSRRDSSSRGASPDGSRGQARSRGFTGGLLTGFSLGLVWTPCVGPIMASVISLAVTQNIDGGAVFIILAYSIGTAIPMLAIMTGGRALMERVPILSRNPVKIQRVFGVLMILVGVAIGFGWDRRFQSAVLNIFPDYGAGLTAFENSEPVRDALDARSESNTGGAVTNRFSREGERGNFNASPENVDLENEDLGDYGYAPEIVTAGEWFNIDALEAEAQDGVITMADLRGKVVLVDFWTYSCINCVRTIPHLRSWYDAYRDDGFVIIGVHTPEFAFERDPENVRKAMKELGVNWPVVLDNDFEQWRAYNNRYWPAHYFIDATGRVRYFHFGEGKYDTSEEVIRALLEEADRLPADSKGHSAARAAEKADAKLESRTAETYLGYGRARGFTSDVSPVPNRPTLYRPPGPPIAGPPAAGSPAAASLANGEWSLDGKWTIAREYIVPEGSGVLQLGFHAKDVFLVIEPAETGGRIKVKVDGKPATDTVDVRDGVLLPNESRLYHLVQQAESAKRVLSLEVSGELRLFAFTFG